MSRQALHFAQFGGVAEGEAARGQIADFIAPDAKRGAGGDGLREVAVDLVSDDSNVDQSSPNISEVFRSV